MKKLLFLSLFFIGFFSISGQNSWTLNGNFACETEFNLGTKENKLITCPTTDYDFNIIRAGETVARFENGRIVFTPKTDHKILIGNPTTTSTPVGYKLYVEQGILTEKVKVALKELSDWSDYVFYDTYDLMPLSQVEAFINEKGHLPNIESAEELLANGGINIGDMQAKQMAKIEELTLHLIQKDKDIKELQKQVTLLSKQLELLFKQ